MVVDETLISSMCVGDLTINGLIATNTSIIIIPLLSTLIFMPELHEAQLTLEDESTGHRSEGHVSSSTPFEGFPEIEGPFL